jgi:tryptophan-rich sensory protein
MKASPPAGPVSRQAAGLAISLLLTFAAAAVGAVASAEAPAFYAQLVLPAWAPPASVFGPVWSVLYALMAVAAWLVWRAHGVAGARPALTVFLAQLAANALWSWLFFGWHRGALAFAEVLLLWGLIAANVVAFWRLSRVAAVLLLPYWLWVTFASALTFAVWQRNPDLL